MTLADRAFVPCTQGATALAAPEIESLLAELGNDWTLDARGHLAKTFRFDDFAQAIGFVNRVGALAEELDHHPEIHLAWGRVTVEIWTHVVKGLALGDFVWAARCERLVRH